MKYMIYTQRLSCPQNPDGRRSWNFRIPPEAEVVKVRRADPFRDDVNEVLVLEGLIHGPEGQSFDTAYAKELWVVEEGVTFEPGGEVKYVATVNGLAGQVTLMPMSGKAPNYHIFVTKKPVDRRIPG